MPWSIRIEFVDNSVAFREDSYISETVQKSLDNAN